MQGISGTEIPTKSPAEEPPAIHFCHTSDSSMQEAFPKMSILYNIIPHFDCAMKHHMYLHHTSSNVQKKNLLRQFLYYSEWWNKINVFLS